jgi:hypothetical protein
VLLDGARTAFGHAFALTQVLGAGGAGRGDTVVVTGHAWAVPWSLVALILLLVGAGLLALRAHARAGARRAGVVDARVQEAVARALTDA